MKNYFECTISYWKQNDQGLVRNAKEKYLVDAMTHTEAESLIYKFAEEKLQSDFQVNRIIPSSITSVYPEKRENIYHKCKITFVTVSDHGKEKKVSEYLLVNAKDIKDAYDYVRKLDMPISINIVSISESPILELING